MLLKLARGNDNAFRWNSRCFRYRFDLAKIGYEAAAVISMRIILELIGVFQ